MVLWGRAWTALAENSGLAREMTPWGGTQTALAEDPVLAREMAPWGGALTALAEDPGLELTTTCQPAPGQSDASLWLL